MKKVLIAVIILAFAVSCSKGGGIGSAGIGKNDVINISGTKLTKADVQKEFDSLPDMAKQYFQGPDGMTRFVDELIKKEILYLEAKKKGFEQNKDYQRKVEEFKKITLINQLLEKEIETTSKITDKDIQDFFNSHKEDFTANNQVKLSQIVVKTDDEVKKVYERVKGGEDFAKVAAEMSSDKASAKAGGNIGSFKKGDLSPELDEAVFRLKKGEVSTPVKLKDGVHIVKVTDAKGTLIEFEKVKGMIGQKLTGDKQKATFEKLMEGLKKSYKVEINKDALTSLTPAQNPMMPGAMSGGAMGGHSPVQQQQGHQ